MITHKYTVQDGRPCVKDTEIQIADVLYLLAEGHTTESIANALGISQKSIQEAFRWTSHQIDQKRPAFYHHISYPKIYDFALYRWFRRKTYCRIGYHLLDEVLSKDHYLFCDACGLKVHIDRIEEC